MAVSLEPVDSVTITVIVDNVSDALLQNQGPARRVGLAGGGGGQPHFLEAPTLDSGRVVDAPQAEHGFSALVEVVKNGAARRILFDAGLTPDGMVNNMRRLDIAPNDVEAIVLSHGHFDHTAGLSGYIRYVGRANLPVIIHPEFWSKRRIAIPGRDPVELPSTSKQALLGAGFEVVEEPRPSFLLGGSLLVTGEVDRTTEFERGFPGHEALRDGQWAGDPLILDDQALVVDVRDKGLVVLTGCGHAGVVNIARHAQALTGVSAVHALIGGFHLNGPAFEPTIPAVTQALHEVAPTYLVPGHCTGWRATHALAASFPDAFIPNSVGTTYEF